MVSDGFLRLLLKHLTQWIQFGAVVLINEPLLIYFFPFFYFFAALFCV